MVTTMLNGNVLWGVHYAAAVETEEDQEFRQTQALRNATLRARGGQQPQEQVDEGMEQSSDEEDHSEGNSDISDEGMTKDQWPWRASHKATSSYRITAGLVQAIVESDHEHEHSEGHTGFPDGTPRKGLSESYQDPQWRGTRDLHDHDHDSRSDGDSEDEDEPDEAD
jgi:hypothetical protein